MENNIEIKKKLLEKWFKRVHEQINLLEYRVRYLDLNNLKNNKYDDIINELETQFANIKVIRKVLKNDAFIRGFDFKELNNK